MFQNNYPNSFNVAPMPTAMQPYGYTTPTYPMQNTPVVPAQTNTNKIFVNGIEDVRNCRLPANSDYIFLDNDKAIIYQKLVDSKGQFEVKAFTITPYTTQPEAPVTKSTDYALKTDLQDLRERLQKLETNLQGAQNNGTTNVE
jgi:hypothetical protein